MLVALGVVLVLAQILPATDGDGLTPLMRAAARGQTAEVTTLAAAGAEVNAAHADTRLTPLMFAAYFGHDAVVRLLLEQGAQANLKDATGASAADWAAQGGHAATAERLTTAGAQMNPFLNVGVLPFALMDKAAGKSPPRFSGTSLGGRRSLTQSRPASTSSTAGPRSSALRTPTP